MTSCCCYCCFLRCLWRLTSHWEGSNSIPGEKREDERKKGSGLFCFFFCSAATLFAHLSPRLATACARPLRLVGRAESGVRCGRPADSVVQVAGCNSLGLYWRLWRDGFHCAKQASSQKTQNPHGSCYIMYIFGRVARVGILGLYIGVRICQQSRARRLYCPGCHRCGPLPSPPFPTFRAFFSDENPPGAQDAERLRFGWSGGEQKPKNAKRDSQPAEPGIGD